MTTQIMAVFKSVYTTFIFHRGTHCYATVNTNCASIHGLENKSTICLHMHGQAATLQH